MRALILFLIMVCSSATQAQVPGFQGKRFTVEGSAMLNIALTNPDESFHTGIGVNKRFQGGVEYILGRSITAGLTGGVFNTGLNYTNYNTNTNSNVYSSHDQYKLNCTIAGVYFKFFKFGNKGSIAPYGSYAKLGLLDLMISGQLDNTDQKGLKHPELSSSSMPFLNFGFGKQTIIRGRFIIRVGADFAFNVNLINAGIANSGSSRGDVQKLAQQRVSKAMLFNLETGLAVLIF